MNPLHPYVFDSARLDALAAAHAAEFHAAQPYPHIVIDDFLDPSAARAMAEAFPGPDDDVAWDHYAAPGLEVKLGCGDETKFPASIRDAIRDLNSSAFVRILEKLSGIEHLLVDPHLLGGGMHLTRAGGVLGIHADFNWHLQIHAHRRLNLLVYLNEDYEGGETTFLRTGLSFKGRKGDALVFRNALPDGRADEMAQHAGLPVTAGEKLIASRWIRARTFTFPPPRPLLDV